MARRQGHPLFHGIQSIRARIGQGAAVKTLVSTHSEVKNDSSRRPRLRSVGLAAVLAVLILELSTGCGAAVAKGSAAGRSGGLAPNPGLVFITIVMIVMGVFLLLQVGRLVGQIFDLATKLASAFASVMLVLALAAGAVILAVFALAAG